MFNLQKLSESLDLAFQGLPVVNKPQFQIGQIVEFDYNGKHRGGTVHVVHPWGVTLKTAGGYRSFRFDKM